MKNIHLLPTDKPSRLLFDKEDNRYLPLQDEPIFMEHQDLVENQHIYITSDEKAKEGDYVIQINFEKTNTQLIHCITEFQVKLANDKDGSFTKKKIILTTDGDLIKDNVQAIDDEFLEWFVKNPSCQYGGYKNIDWDKIITQKEEPKQETLEEASERIYPTTIDSFTDNGFDLSERERLIFINGAEWQAERMYSKEDMEYAFKSSSLTNVLDVYESFEEFIGQYKKK